MWGESDCGFSLDGVGLLQRTDQALGVTIGDADFGGPDRNAEKQGGNSDEDDPAHGGVLGERGYLASNFAVRCPEDQAAR